MTDLAVSRRAVTRALATLPAIAIPSLAAATSSAGFKGDEMMNMHASMTTTAIDRRDDALSSSHRIDADFWAAHARWKRIDTEWDAVLERDPNLDDESFSNWGNRHKSAFDDMIAAPISSIIALSVKMEAISEGPDSQFRDTHFSLFDVVRFDAERLAKSELLA